MAGSGQDIGYYALPVVPSFEGGIKSIDKQLSKAFDGVSKSASKAISGGVQDGVDAAERAVKASSQKIVALREKEADAAGKLRVAEERLNEVRNSGKGGSTLARAEEAREKAFRGQAAALRNVESESRQAERAAKDLADAQEKAAKGPKSGGGSSSWLDTLKGKADKATESLQKIGEHGISASGEGAGSSFVEGFAGKIQGLGGKGGPIAVALAAAATVALGAGALIANQVVKGMEQQQEQANIQAKLGVDDATMKKIADSAGQAYAGNFGESVAANLDAARVAIQDGLIDPTATSSATQKMVEQLSTVSTVLGAEIPETAKAAQQAIATGLVPNATAAFDLLVKAQQAGLNKSEDLLDTLNEYGTQFRKLGISGPEAVGLISQAMKGGARDSDVAADALKEFSIRAVDGSKTTVDGFTKIGLNADIMAQKFAAGGQQAHDGLAQVLDGLRNIKDPVEQSRIAVELFGTQAEDLGGALNKFDLTHAVDQLGQVDGAAQKASDTVGGTAASSWESLQRTAEVALDGIQQQLATAFGPGIKELADDLSSHKADLIEFFTSLGDFAITAAQGVTRGLGAITEAFGGFISIIGKIQGSVLKFESWQAHIRGDEDTAKELHDQSEEAYGWGKSLQDAGAAMQAYADGALPEFKKKLQEAGAQAADAARLTDALGKTVASIPDGKDIVISDNSPETIGRLKALGIEVEQTPTGLKLTATTDEAQHILDSFRAQQTGQPLTPPVKPDLAQADADMRGWFDKWQSAVVNPTVRVPGQGVPGQNPLLAPFAHAAGGMFSRMPKSAMIQPATPGLVQWAEPSTGGEAYIPLNGGQRSVDIWQQTGRELGVWKFEQGGIRPDVAAAEALVGTAYSQDTRFDCSGDVARVINQALGSRDTSLMSTQTAPQWLAARGFKPGIGGPGTISVGWYNHGPNPNDGHMAMTLSDGRNAEGGGSHGSFLVGAGAEGASSAQFDQHMYLPNLYGEGVGAAGGGSGQGGGAGVKTSSGGGSGSGGSGSGGSGSGGLGSIGDIIGGGLKETLGLDGSFLPDPSQIGLVKLAQAILGIKYTPQGTNFKGGLLEGAGNVPGFDLSGGGGGGGSFPFGMIPSAIQAAGIAAPGMAPPGSAASGQGSGTAPGPVDASTNVSVTASPGMDEIANAVRREVLNVKRLDTYVPAGA